LSATVSEHAGRWFVSVQVEIEIPEPETAEKPVAGIDLGIVRLATVSDGMRIENPRALKRNLRQIKRLQRTVARRQTGSAIRRKAVQKLAQAHVRVANLRKDTLHQATSLLAKTKSAVVLEDLNVSGMMKNHHLAQAIADVGWYEFRRPLTYKGEWYGCQVLFADRFYPSTKRCSHCGNVKAGLDLSERVYECEVEVCGLIIDRDLNAALNLERWPTASSAERNACGEGVRPGCPAVLDEAGTEPRSTACRSV
jgi:putative transposase